MKVVRVNCWVQSWLSGRSRWMIGLVGSGTENSGHVHEPSAPRRTVRANEREMASEAIINPRTGGSTVPRHCRKSHLVEGRYGVMTGDSAPSDTARRMDASSVSSSRAVVLFLRRAFQRVGASQMRLLGCPSASKSEFSSVALLLASI